MGIADDLLTQAAILIYDEADPNQASLRRAVSAAYYALFHSLTEDAAQRWQGTSEARTGIERGFQHGPMANISRQFKNKEWRDWHDTPQSIPEALRKVAGALVRLQEQRHVADYLNYKRWSVTEAEEMLVIAIEAVDKWQSIRADPMAGNYLLAMLLNRQRS